MHDYPNGTRPPWHAPSPWDMLLHSLSRIERKQDEQSSRLGGLETGQEHTLMAVEKSFDLHRETADRLSQLEAASASRPPLAPPGLLASLSALSATVKEMLPLVAAVLYLLAALGAAINPELPRAILNIDER